jgi:cell shape-determining protein MreC
MGIYDTLKSTASVLREADKIEQYRQILDAMEKLLELQNKLAELEKENKSLKEKLKI